MLQGHLGQAASDVVPNHFCLLTATLWCCPLPSCGPGPRDLHLINSTADVTGCYFQNQDTQTLVCVASLIKPAVILQLHQWKGPCGKRLRSSAQQPLRNNSANSCMSVLGGGPFRQDCSPSHRFCSLCEAPSQKTQLSVTLRPDLQNLWDDRCRVLSHWIWWRGGRYNLFASSR